MQRKLLRDAEQYARQNQRRHIRNRFVQILACVVVFCTTYALILPAITMEKMQCELEEHTHSETCFKKIVEEPAVSSVCTYESLGIHEHTSECYDSEHNILCGFADYVVHEHNDDCLDNNGSLICRLPVVREHEHTEDCYRIPEAAGTTETEAVHVHNADCYATVPGTLVCKITGGIIDCVSTCLSAIAFMSRSYFTFSWAACWSIKYILSA